MRQLEVKVAVIATVVLVPPAEHRLAEIEVKRVVIERRLQSGEQPRTQLRLPGVFDSGEDPVCGIGERSSISAQEIAGDTQLPLVARQHPGLIPDIRRRVQDSHHPVLPTVSQVMVMATALPAADVFAWPNPYCDLRSSCCCLSGQSERCAELREEPKSLL